MNTIEILLPPLHERKEDIPLLAFHFLRKYSQRYLKKISGFDDAAMKSLLNYSWPGNVRELDHAVERAALLAQGNLIRAGDLGLRESPDGAPRLDQMSLEEVERILIQKALARSGGNVSQAAQSLGLSRSGLYRRLQKYGL